jgi:hypothetical protein
LHPNIFSLEENKSNGSSPSIEIMKKKYWWGKKIRLRRKTGDRVEREKIPNTLKTTISKKNLSTRDNDQPLIKSYKFIIT